MAMRIGLNRHTAKIGMAAAGLIGFVVVGFNTNWLNEKYCPQCHTDQYMINGDVEYQRRLSERQAERMKALAAHKNIGFCGNALHAADDLDRDLLVDSWYCEKCGGVSEKFERQMKRLEDGVVGILRSPE